MLSGGGTTAEVADSSRSIGLRCGSSSGIGRAGRSPPGPAVAAGLRSLAGGEEKIRTAVAADPDRTPAETLRQHLGREGVRVDRRPGILRRLGLTRQVGLAAEQDVLLDIQKRRAEWPGVMAWCPPGGFTSSTRPGPTWPSPGPKGTPPGPAGAAAVSEALEDGHVRGGLTAAGMTAPLAFDGPMTGAVFVAYV